MFVEDEAVKAFAAARTSKGRVRVGMQAVVSSITGGVGIVQPDRDQAGSFPLGMRRMVVRDLLTPGRTSSNSIQFWQETGFTNNARTQSEGAVKGESTITGELVTKAVATIAHFIKASKQVLDDMPMLQSHIDGQLTYGLAYEEELQLLLGDGTGVNLDGLVPNATDVQPVVPPAEPDPHRHPAAGAAAGRVGAVPGIGHGRSTRSTSRRSN
jgi:HK97 family phage major capsid protein